MQSDCHILSIQKKQRLCLFIRDEWNCGKLICDTIIHWAVQWMLYYESWRYTGVWLGGGLGNWDAIVSDEQSKTLNEGKKSRLNLRTLNKLLRFEQIIRIYSKIFGYIRISR